MTSLHTVLRLSCTEGCMKFLCCALNLLVLMVSCHSSFAHHVQEAEVWQVKQLNGWISKKTGRQNRSAVSENLQLQGLCVSQVFPAARGEESKQKFPPLDVSLTEQYVLIRSREHSGWETHATCLQLHRDTEMLLWASVDFLSLFISHIYQNDQRLRVLLHIKHWKTSNYWCQLSHILTHLWCSRSKLSDHRRQCVGRQGVQSIDKEAPYMKMTKAFFFSREHTFDNVAPSQF